VREAERLALAGGLLLLVLVRPSPWSVAVVLGVSSAVLWQVGRPGAVIAAWLAAPLPFLLASTMAGWWALWPTGAPADLVTVRLTYAQGGRTLLLSALRAEACTAAAGVAVLTVSVPVAAATALRLRVPVLGVEVLVLALRVVDVAGRTLRARLRVAPMRFGAHSARARLRTSAGLAATMAAVTHHRTRRLDTMMELRGTPDWHALAAMAQPARRPVLVGIAAVLVLLGVIL
jgi:hypothetical protein